ncbi:MAG: hypothetical protein ACFE7R_04290 [Candidatus Hodarchaeota archaeon]
MYELFSFELDCDVSSLRFIIIYLYRYARAIALVEIFFGNFFLLFLAIATVDSPPISECKSDGTSGYNPSHLLVLLFG